VRKEVSLSKISKFSEMFWHFKTAKMAALSWPGTSQLAKKAGCQLYKLIDRMFGVMMVPVGLRLLAALPSNTVDSQFYELFGSRPL
jgi:hypothetical protein